MTTRQEAKQAALKYFESCHSITWANFEIGRTDYNETAAEWFVDQMERMGLLKKEEELEIVRVKIIRHRDGAVMEESLMPKEMCTVSNGEWSYGQYTSVGWARLEQGHSDGEWFKAEVS